MNKFRKLLFHIPRQQFRGFAQASISNAVVHGRFYKRFVSLSVISGCAFYHFMNRGTLFAKVDEATAKVIEEADHLYSTGDDPRHLYDYLKKHKNSNDADVLWRAARAARDLALKGKDVSKDEKKSLIYEAFENSKRSLELDETNWGAHKWFGITIGDVGDYEGTKVKISNAYIIKDHLERALQLNPNDATTAHCLGMWCMAFADMPWYQQKLASVLFATPPTSTHQEAIKMFELAEKTEPNFYSVNLLMLGRCYEKIGDVKRAMMYFDKAIDYRAVTEEDHETIKSAKDHLKALIAGQK